MIETTPAPNEFKEWKSFHLGAVLTITTGIMVAPGGVGDIYDILNWMTGENLFTHQLPRASDECEPVLKDLYPGLAAVTRPDTTKLANGDQETFWKNWLANQVKQFGENLPVPKLLVHEGKDPIEELFEMRGRLNPTAPIVVVVAPDEDLGKIEVYLENDGGLEGQIDKIVKEVLHGDTGVQKPQ
jgi:hypothetical protein